MAIVTFLVVMVKVLLGGSSLSLGTFAFSFGTIDSFSIAALLTPTLGAYVARRVPGIGGSGAGSKPNAGRE